MQLILLLLLALGVTALLTLFPDIANESIRIEAFGWIFETRQGAFVVGLLALFFALWLVRTLISAILAGPGQIWATLRMGSHKRRELRLREAITQWINMRGDLGARTLKRSKGVLPEWALEMLKALATPAKDQALAKRDRDPLVTAMAARIVSDPEAYPKPDLSVRKAHIDTWLGAYPDSPLALVRLVDIAEEENDWQKAAATLEQILKQGHRSPHRVQPRLAKAYANLAAQQPEQALAHLRKAYRLAPDNGAIVCRLGRTMLQQDEARDAEKMWWNFLEKNSDFTVATHMFEHLRANAMPAYKRLERRESMRLNPALRWLKAELAHAANLGGLAEEQMRELAEQSGCHQAWQSLGNWYRDGGDFARAAECYARVISLAEPPQAG